MSVVPIEDAVTVAYVDIVHALSELKEVDDYIRRLYSHEAIDHYPFDALGDLHAANEDLTRALEMLRPHVEQIYDQRRASNGVAPIGMRPTDDPNVVVHWTAQPTETTQEYFTRLGW